MTLRLHTADVQRIETRLQQLQNFMPISRLQVAILYKRVDVVNDRGDC